MGQTKIKVGHQAYIVGSTALVTVFGISPNGMYATEDAEGRCWFFARDQLVALRDQAHDR